MHRTTSSNRAKRHISTSVLLLMITVCIALLAMLAVTPQQADAQQLRQRSVFSPMNGGDIRAGTLARLGSVISTWYGPGFWGHRTACGRTLRQGSWGIAHRTLPCGRMVLLKFRGRQVAVPVIDRGPYSGATIDLTERTASFLRFRQAGSGRVKMAVLDRRLPVRRL